jgi:hypothetical protein
MVGAGGMTKGVIDMYTVAVRREPHTRGGGGCIAHKIGSKEDGVYCNVL